MLNKKSIKILSIVVMIMMLLVTMGNVAFAEPISLNPKLPTSDTVESLQGTVEQILGIIQWAGIIAAVVIAMFVGIKLSFIVKFSIGISIYQIWAKIKSLIAD